MLKIRYFRKYGRVLLIVFMSLLLVVFLVGDVIGRGRNQDMLDLERGTVDGQKVMSSDVRQAHIDMEIARLLRVPTPPIMGSEDQSGLLAYLLIREAENAGVRVGRDQVQSLLSAMGDTGEALTAVRDRQGVSLNRIYESIGRVLSVLTYFGYQYEAASGESLPRLERSFRDQNQDADVRISVIDANAFIDLVPEPTDEELRAHFEAAKDRPERHTEDELVYGYRIPARVTLETLTVDPQLLEKVVRVKEKDVRRYFEENKPLYRRPVDSQPAAPIGQAAPEMITPEFEEVRERVKEDFRRVKAIEEAQRQVNRLHEEAIRPWLEGAPDASGKRPAPPADKIISFADLAAKSTEVTPTVNTLGPIDAQALAREPGIGRASALINRRPTPITTLAFRVENLVTPEQAGDGLPTLRLGEPGPVVLEQRPSPLGRPEPYQAYLFRVTDADPAGPPENLDAVRDTVRANLRVLKAQEMAGEWAKKLAERAREVGLEQAVQEATELREILAGKSEAENEVDAQDRAARARMLDPITPERFRRQPGFVQNVGFSRSLHEKAFAALEDGAAHHVAAVQNAAGHKWIVVETLGIKPMYRGAFEQQLARLEQGAARQAQSMYEDWYSPEAIMARTGFVPARAESD